MAKALSLLHVQAVVIIYERLTQSESGKIQKGSTVFIIVVIVIAIAAMSPFIHGGAMQKRGRLLIRFFFCLFP